MTVVVLWQREKGGKKMVVAREEGRTVVLVFEPFSHFPSLFERHFAFISPISLVVSFCPTDTFTPFPPVTFLSSSYLSSFLVSTSSHWPRFFNVISSIDSLYAPLRFVSPGQCNVIRMGTRGAIISNNE